MDSLKEFKIKKESQKEFKKMSELEEHYNKQLSDKLKKLDLLKTKYEQLETKENKIQIKINDNEKELINLTISPKKTKYKWYKRFYYYITNTNPTAKIQGYIFYLDKNYNLTIYDVKDGFNNLFKVIRKKYGESYMLHKYMGLWNNKRFFIVKFPYAISLELFQETYASKSEEGEELTEVALAYDSVAYYNLLEHTIKRNITIGENPKTEGVLGLLKDYWIIVLVFVVMAFLFFTPQGKEMLTQLLAGFKA